MRNSIWLVVVAIAGLVFGAGAHADDKNIHALLQVNSYGWEVEVSRNERLIQSGGGGSRISQLFGVDHPIKSKLGEAAKNLLCLHQGENYVDVSYIPAKGNTTVDDLEVTISTASVTPDGKRVNADGILFDKTIKVGAEGGKYRQTFRIR